MLARLCEAFVPLPPETLDHFGGAPLRRRIGRLPEDLRLACVQLLQEIVGADV